MQSPSLYPIVWQSVFARHIGNGNKFDIGTPAVTQYYFIRAYNSANKESGSSDP